MEKSEKSCLLTGLNIITAIFCIFSFSTVKGETAANQTNPGLDIIFTGTQIADTVYIKTSPIPADTTLFFNEYLEKTRNCKSKSYPVVNNMVHICTDTIPSIYNIQCDYYKLPTVYMRDSDHVVLEINSLSPSRYHRSGSLYSDPIPYSNEFSELKLKLSKIRRSKLSEHELDSLSSALYTLIDTIMATCLPEKATYAISMLEEDFAPYAFERLPAGSENTLYYTHACALRNTGLHNSNQKQMLQQALKSNATIPEFTLPDINNDPFNISSLRGKWVILDFWTSWCGPCRKGFITMKKLYAEHTDKLEIVAIACGDQETVWRQLVHDLELPWINLLAPAPTATGSSVAGIPITAYPTKVIIDPDGRLRDYIVGENEDFYDKLEELLK